MNGIPITPPILGKMFDDGYFTPKDCKQGNHKDIDYNDDGVLICLWCGEEMKDIRGPINSVENRIKHNRKRFEWKDER